jgi:methyl-accepting chemotaxis protein
VDVRPIRDEEELMGGDRRRRRLVVDGKLQLGMALHIVGYVYLYLVLFALLANVGSLKTVLFGGSEEAYIVAVTRLKIFVEVFVVPLAATFVCMCLHGVLFSHKVAGPLYRFRETLRKIKQGDLANNIKIRKDDFFQDLCDEVNGMITQLRGDLVHFRKASQELAEEGESLAEAGDLPEEAQKKLLGITNASTRLRQLVDGYRLVDTDPHQPEPEDAEMPETAGV